MTMARSSGWMRMGGLWRVQWLAPCVRQFVLAASELSSADHLFSRRKSEPRIVGGPTQVKKSLLREAARPGGCLPQICFSGQDALLRTAFSSVNALAGFLA
jgi:hypothetical protein